MNKNQIEGDAKDIGGKIQEKAGKLVGSSEQQVKGMGHQVEGKVQKQVGNMQEAIKDADKRAAKEGNKQ
ncbi:MAG TPA: CsbD family protein [Janthinobacterium sp.]|nr:CsbD family protein [Janthinobacterium sp.]